MRDRETYDNYLDIPVSPEVREFLEENARELKRQRDHAYQYGVSCHACDMDKQNNAWAERFRTAEIAPPLC